MILCIRLRRCVVASAMCVCERRCAESASERLGCRGAKLRLPTFNTCKCTVLPEAVLRAVLEI